MLWGTGALVSTQYNVDAITQDSNGNGIISKNIDNPTLKKLYSLGSVVFGQGQNVYAIVKKGGIMQAIGKGDIPDFDDVASLSVGTVQYVDGVIQISK